MLHTMQSPRASVRQLFAVTCTVLLALHVNPVSSHGGRQMTYIVSKQEMACFSNVWKDSEKIFFEYQVVRGGQKDLNVQIITPNGMVLYDKERATSDEVTFTPQNGEFKFCFSNEFSKMTDKVVTFSLRPAFTSSLSEEIGDTVPRVKKSSETSCDVIHEATSAALDFQRKYRIRESIGRHLAEQLNRMVTWWSMGQSLVVMLCSVGQVLVLRTFFMEKRSSTKLPEGEPHEKQVITYT
ncbi:transmembrane emp24 domain-containing protein 7-like [Littorina saxatilis]|uniref:GOLD domain-containing protein n=1 Tax=Littorina saxatilis TaxID=31220 RepID=A0AAN9GCV2_9CAEN